MDNLDTITGVVVGVVLSTICQLVIQALQRKGAKLDKLREARIDFYLNFYRKYIEFEKLIGLNIAKYKLNKCKMSEIIDDDIIEKMKEWEKYLTEYKVLLTDEAYDTCNEFVKSFYNSITDSTGKAVAVSTQKEKIWFEFLRKEINNC